MYKVVVLSQQDYEYRNLKIRLGNIIEDLGGSPSFFKRGNKVLLKPNMLSARNPERRVTTDPSVVRAIAELVIDAGGKPYIGDSPPGIEPFSLISRKTGIREISDLTGIPLVEFKETRKTSTQNSIRFKNLNISSKVLDSDVVINIPKLKTHCQMLLTLGVKNMFGTIVAQEKAEWHYKVGLDRDIFATLLLDIYNAVRPSLTILDGIWGMEGHGPGNGKPRHFGILAGSADALAMDITLCRLLGVALDKYPLYRAARKAGYSQADPQQIRLEGDMTLSQPFSDVEVPSLDNLHVLPPFLRYFGNSLTSRPVQDPQKCIGCGECIKMCSAGAIDLKQGNRLEYDYDKCVRCFCCQEVCPADAINFKKGWLLKLMEYFKK